MMRQLFHYTCRHAYDQLGRSGTLLPATSLTDAIDAESWWPARYVWLTDLTVPIRDALGLTSSVITCDRTEFRYVVTSYDNVIPWIHERHRIPDPWLLELHDGTRPAHWYVSRQPVPVALDHVTRRHRDVT